MRDPVWVRCCASAAECHIADGGGDSHVRIKGMDHIVITNYKNFANAVNVLLK